MVAQGVWGALDEVRVLVPRLMIKKSTPPLTPLDEAKASAGRIKEHLAAITLLVGKLEEALTNAETVA